MMEIKYLDQSVGYLGDNQPRWDADRDYGSEYVRVYFRIDAHYYQYPFKAYEGLEADKEAYRFDCRQLFESLGWDYVEGKYQSSCASAKQGLKSLYLHPQGFSGIVLKNDVKPIAEAIAKYAKTYSLRWVDVYETYYSMSEEAYETYLNGKKDHIRRKVFEAFQTKRRTQFKWAAGGCFDLGKEIRLCRVEQPNYNTLGASFEEKYLLNLVDEMIEEGYLVAQLKGESLNIRSLNKTEMKKLNLAPIL